MLWVLIFVVVIVAFVVLAAVASKQKGGGSSVGLPYRLEKSLFSAAERSFLGVLDQAVGPEHRVFGKVRVADLAAVKPGLSQSARRGALNRVGSKHFDFVVCRASDLAVVCVVELNDKSHASKRAQARDELLTNVCRVIGLPLLKVPAKRSYVMQELRTQVLSAIGEPQVEAMTAT